MTPSSAAVWRSSPAPPAASVPPPPGASARRGRARCSPTLTGGCAASRTGAGRRRACRRGARARRNRPRRRGRGARPRRRCPGRTGPRRGERRVFDLTPIERLERERLERVLAVNLMGTFWTFKAAIAHLRADGGGTLLATASQAGLRGWAQMSAYSASKFGVIGLVQSLAQELAGEGIRVCAVAPGITETPMYREVIDGRSEVWGVSEGEAVARLHAGIPAGRPPPRTRWRMPTFTWPLTWRATFRRRPVARRRRAHGVGSGRRRRFRLRPVAAGKGSAHHRCRFGHRPRHRDPLRSARRVTRAR